MVEAETHPVAAQASQDSAQIAAHEGEPTGDDLVQAVNPYLESA